jgi:hypothetical protein
MACQSAHSGYDGPIDEAEAQERFERRYRQGGLINPR